MSRIYLDNNATTMIAPEVKQTYISACEQYGNPSSIHSFGREAKKIVEQSRDSIAQNLNCSPRELFFTSSGTEGLNILIRGVFGFFPKGHIITSQSEHPAVFATVSALEEAGCTVSYLLPGLLGAPTPEQVIEAITPHTKLIVLSAANNETGVRLNYGAVAAIAQAHDIPFVLDGVQLLGKDVFTIPEGVCAMAFSGHKIHAPKGISFVFMRKSFRPHAVITGGHQEGGRRPGTENVQGIAALGKAIELCFTDLPQTISQMKALRDQFENELISTCKSVRVNGEGLRIANTSNLAFIGRDGEGVLQALDMRGIAASLGSACATGALEPSRTLLSMGLSREHARSSIRFSLSRYTTKDEIRRAIQVIREIVG